MRTEAEHNVAWGNSRVDCGKQAARGCEGRGALRENRLGTDVGCHGDHGIGEMHFADHEGSSRLMAGAYDAAKTAGMILSYSRARPHGRRARRRHRAQSGMRASKDAGRNAGSCIKAVV